MNETSHATSWHRDIDVDGIITLSLDLPDSSTNILTDVVINDLSLELNRIQVQRPTGLILRSAKSNGFIAGADIKTFAQQHDVDETFAAIKHVHSVINSLENLNCPSVAVIHGFCLGGGLELALACRYLLADESPATRIGLPEVKLGIHPGYGGSLRLVERIGVLNAMPLMLSGRLLSAYQAQKVGLIDQSVPQRLLLKRAKELLLQKNAPLQAPCWHRLLAKPMIRPAIAAFLRKKTAKKIQQSHYPAPFAVIDLWQHQPASRIDYLTAEARSVAELIQTDTAQNLVRLFFLQERLKTFGKQADFKARHVHVIGAGVMGGDIAAWCALRGLTVSLQDTTHAQIAPAVARAHRLFATKLRQPHLIRQAQDRLIPDSAGESINKADVVIEAIFEDLSAKQTLFDHIEPVMRSDAILATNTSSIPLEKLAEGLQDPTRLVGLHFFNPVAKMQLVEIVSSSTTSQAWALKAAAFARQIGRLPLAVKSSPGFLVNRILMPYLLEAIIMVDEGIAISDIDQTAKYFGMPMGPIELADAVGLDICLSVGNMLAPVYGLTIPSLLEDKVNKNLLGRKTAEGFYQYDKQHHRLSHKPTKNSDSALIEQRLILRLINECIACLNEGIVEDADLIDAGMVLGTGFAPFRGGPMQYLQQQGKQTLWQRLVDLQARFGERFEPDSGWEGLS